MKTNNNIQLTGDPKSSRYGNPVPSSRTHKIYIIKNHQTQLNYIGQTCLPIKERFRQHLKRAREGKQSKLYKHIQQIGAQEFYIELLKDNISTDDIDQLEIDYIAQYNTCQNGLNTSPGGDSKYINRAMDVDVIKTLYQWGQSTTQIALLYDVNSATIGRVLKAADVELRYDNIKSNKIKEQGFIDDYMNTELSTQQIADKYNMSTYSVRRWGRRFKLPHRERNREGVSTIFIVEE